MIDGSPIAQTNCKNRSHRRLLSALELALTKKARWNFENGERALIPRNEAKTYLLPKREQVVNLSFSDNFLSSIQYI